MCVLSCVRFFVTPWTVAQPRRILYPWNSPRQEYWSGLPFPPPEDLPDPGIKPESPALAGRLFTAEPPQGDPRCSLPVGINAPADPKAGGVLLKPHLLPM